MSHVSDSMILYNHAAHPRIIDAAKKKVRDKVKAAKRLDDDHYTALLRASALPPNDDAFLTSLDPPDDLAAPDAAATCDVPSHTSSPVTFTLWPPEARPPELVQIIDLDAHKESAPSVPKGVDRQWLIEMEAEVDRRMERLREFLDEKIQEEAEAEQAEREKGHPLSFIVKRGPKELTEGPDTRPEEVEALIAALAANGKRVLQPEPVFESLSTKLDRHGNSFAGRLRSALRSLRLSVLSIIRRRRRQPVSLEEEEVRGHKNFQN